MKNYTLLLFTLLFIVSSEPIHAQSLSTQHTNNILDVMAGGPCYNLTESTAVCSGSDYTFPDGSAQTITAQVVHTSTLHTVVTNCDSIIVTTVDALPTYNQTQSLFNICPGNNYTFPDGTTQFITAHTEYTSTLQTVGSHCDSIILTILNTTDLDPTVVVSGNTLFAVQGNAGYQWVDCDNGYAQVNGANGQSYTAVSGNFAVIIYKGNCTDTSECHTVGTVGINDLNGSRNFVYPNPTTGLFKVNLGYTCSELTMIIRNTVGQQIQVRTMRNVSLFDAGLDAAAGLYFMELQGADGLHVSYKIVKE